MPEPFRVARNVMWLKNFSFKNLLRQKADSSQVNHQDGYITYGSDDQFPLKLAKLIEESPAGAACLSTLTDFVEGNGFSVAELGKLKINSKGETFDRLHSKVAESFVKNEGFYINVKYSAAGLKTEFYFMPFENCRLELPDKAGIIQHVHYNPYFGTNQYKKHQTKKYRIYNPDPKVVQSQLLVDKKEYLGQMYFFGTTRAMHRFYPEPEYYSAAHWFEVDARIGEYWKNNLASAFLQSTIFKIIGDPNTPSENPEYLRKNATTGEYESIATKSKEWSDMMSQNFSGTDRVGNILTFWANAKEEFPEVQAFPSDAKAEIFKIIQDTTIKNITIATKTPAILANIQEGVSLGGDGNTIQASVKLMQQRVVKKHHTLESCYTELLTGFTGEPIKGKEVSIVHYDPYPEDVTVDQKIWDEMTSDERRKWIQKNTDVELLPKPQIQTTQPAQPGPAQPPTQKLDGPKNVLYNSYPEAAKKNATTAIRHREGDSTIRCGTKMGWDVAQTISEGGPLSYKQIRRIRNFLVRHEEFKNHAFNECKAVMYHMWGGHEMQVWCTEKIREVEE